MSVFSRTSVLALLGAAALLECGTKAENTYETDRATDRDSHVGWADASPPSVGYGASAAPVNTSVASWPSLVPEAGPMINATVPPLGAGGAPPIDAGPDGAGGGAGADAYVPPDTYVPPDASGNVIDDFYVNQYLTLYNSTSYSTGYADTTSSVTYSGGPVRLQPLISVSYTYVTVDFSVPLYSTYMLYGYAMKISNNPIKYYSDTRSATAGTGSIGLRVSSTVCSYLSTTCYATTIQVSPVTYYSGYGYATTSAPTTSIPLLVDCGGCP